MEYKLTPEDYLNSYQNWIEGVVWSSAKEHGLLWNTTALSSEVGEFCQLVEKHFRKGSEIDVKDVRSELGDILWHVACLANKFNLTLTDIMEHNVDKIEKRIKKNERKTTK